MYPQRWHRPVDPMPSRAGRQHRKPERHRQTGRSSAAAGVASRPGACSLIGTRAMLKPTTSTFLVGLLTGIVAASAGFAMIGRPGSSNGAAGARVLRVAHALPTSHPVHLGIEYMARRAGELSGGRLRLEVFPSEQLGTETQCLEQAQAGTLAITKVSAGAIGNFVQSYRIFSLPYLFRDSDHLWRVLDGPIGRSLLDMLAVGNDGRPSGLRG